MLSQRIITALVLIPLVAAGVLYLSTPVLALLLAVIVLLGGVEWTVLAQLQTRLGKAQFLVLLAAAMAGLVLLYLESDSWIFPLAAVAVTWWGLVTLLLFGYPAPASLIAGRSTRFILGFIVLLPPWGSLLVIHHAFPDGPYLVLFVMALIWVADSAAYFTGRRWGRTKLAPALSPGKTREGVYGALAGALLCGVVLYLLRPGTGPLLLIIIFTITIALVSVVGDLFESLMKRQAGIKDSGSLLPGHGGVLDRIDSLTAALPLYLLGLLLLERMS